MRGMSALVLAVALVIPAYGPPAHAASVRPTLPAQAGSSHFLVHYDPTTAAMDYVTSALADFEESYSKLVAGGASTPNAGLRPPVDDAPRGGDGRTDVYLMSPPGQSDSWVGGQAWPDNGTYADPLVDSGFLFMTPTLSRVGFRFRSAHEFMHLIQDAYIDTVGLFTESTANWASDFALPDIEPGDSQFEVPFLPLDCSYLDWKGEACGNGYRQWLFFEWLSEHFGDGFIHRLWTVHATQFKISGTSPSLDRQIMTKAIADEPGEASLASMYTGYAAALWDPTLWRTSAVNTMYAKHGGPTATDVGVTRAVPSTGARSAAVDHFATRFIRFQQTAASGPGDVLRVSVTAPPGADPPRLLSAGGPGLARKVVGLNPVGGGRFEATTSLDAANVNDVVLPLTNNTATDNLAFTYSAELIPGGPAAAPANDERANPLTIAPRTTTELDVAYAGGIGSTEASDCASTKSSRRGVWFSLLTDKGPMTVDARASDFTAAVAVYDVTVPASPTLWGCSELDEGAIVSGDTFARQYLIYVGKAASSGPGHMLRLTVDAVPNQWQDTTDSAPPVVSGLAISPRRFSPAKKGSAVTAVMSGKGGARLSFTLNVAASVRFSVSGKVPGRVVRGRCVKPTKGNRGNKVCRRTATVAGVRLSGLSAGRHVLKLTGRRTSAKALSPGAYRLGVVATDRLGSSSDRVTAGFRIKR